MAINNQGCGESRKGGDILMDTRWQPFYFCVGNLEAMDISKFPSSGQPCAFCALLIPTTGSPSDRGPNGTFTDNAGNLSGRLGRRWAVRTDGMESLRRSRTISRGELLGEPSPTSYPPCGPLASPPCPPQQFELVARHGSGDATAPRPFETHPTIISWTSSRLLSRSRRHALSPLPLFL